MNLKLDPKEYKDIIERINSDPLYRVELAKNSFYWFFLIYFNNYVKFPMAPFHKEIFKIAEDANVMLAVIVAFRGSAKSTIMSLAYPIWSILGKLNKRFPLLVNYTQERAQETLSHIRGNLERNELLNLDFGPFGQRDLWRDNTLAITKYLAKITAVSIYENIRGIRNNNVRPDLIIGDDLEDVNSAKTKEGRDKGWQFLNSEVFPTGDINTKKIIIGNLVHEDSIIMRLKNAIEEKKMNGVFKAYPLITDKGEIMWKEKFPNMEAIEKFKKTTVGSELDWLREYLLKIVSNLDSIVRKEWIQYYDELPNNFREHLEYAAAGIDLAIGLNTNNDYTAIVSAYVCKFGNELKIFILPNIINERLNFPEAVDKIKWLFTSLNTYGARLFIEDYGFQRAYIEQLNKEGFYAEGLKVFGKDKRSKIALTTPYIKNSQIFFPRKGAEELIRQLTGLDVEKHDDLADAFAILILKIMEEENKPKPELVIF